MTKKIGVHGRLQKSDTSFPSSLLLAVEFYISWTKHKWEISVGRLSAECSTWGNLATAESAQIPTFVDSSCQHNHMSYSWACVKMFVSECLQVEPGLHTAAILSSHLKSFFSFVYSTSFYGEEFTFLCSKNSKVLCVWVGRAENRAEQFSRSLTCEFHIKFSSTAYFERADQIAFVCTRPTQT